MHALFLFLTLASSANNDSTVRVMTWEERIVAAVDSHESGFKYCFRGAPRASDDAHTFHVLLNADGQPSRLVFRPHDDRLVTKAMACVADELTSTRFPSFEGPQREIELVLRPLGSGMALKQ